MVEMYIKQENEHMSYFWINKNGVCEYAFLEFHATLVEFIGDLLCGVKGENIVPFLNRDRARIFMKKDHPLYVDLKNERLRIEEPKPKNSQNGKSVI